MDARRAVGTFRPGVDGHHLVAQLCVRNLPGTGQKLGASRSRRTSSTSRLSPPHAGMLVGGPGRVVHGQAVGMSAASTGPTRSRVGSSPAGARRRTQRMTVPSIAVNGELLDSLHHA